MIQISNLQNSEYLVTVHAQGVTKHEVILDDKFFQTLTEGRINKEDLIKISFEFLLKNESNQNILRRFNLSMISQYFPDYEVYVKNRIDAEV